MTGATPYFTVVMATYGRGRHIRPSVQSVLAQRFDGYELIVVGDACTDETEAVVAEFPEVRWINLVERCGSQSAPNNAGIAAARGGVIAYIGHDDIWDPGHLAALARVLRGGDAPDFAVSGLILHMQNGMPGSEVMGLFADGMESGRFVFPPSCVSHRKAVCDRIGLWREPMEIRAPVDEDFMLRAVAAGMRFASTGVVTVHKFSSAQRYLSYVRQSSAEQEAMLADIVAMGHADRVALVVAEARRQGKFMQLYSRNYEAREPGELARENAARRGLQRVPLLLLGKGRTLRQRHEFCALDWQDRPVFGIRRHHSNPRPRVLVPVVADGWAKLTIRVVHPDRSAMTPLELLCNEVPVTALPTGLRRSLWGWTAQYRAVIRLLPDQPTVLELLLTQAQLRKVGVGTGLVGFGIGKLSLRPTRSPATL